MSNLWNSLLSDKLPCGHSFSQHIQRQAGIDIGPCIEKPKVRLMMDSGAFSSFTLGKPVSVSEYSDFILKNERYIDESICLDVIEPGNPERAAEAGMKNFLYMKD